MSRLLLQLLENAEGALPTRGRSRELTIADSVAVAYHEHGLNLSIGKQKPSDLASENSTFDALDFVTRELVLERRVVLGDGQELFGHFFDQLRDLLSPAASRPA